MSIFSEIWQKYFQIYDRNISRYMIEILQKYFQIYDRNMAEIFSDLGQKYFQKYGRNIFRNMAEIFSEIWQKYGKYFQKYYGKARTEQNTQLKRAFSLSDYIATTRTQFSCNEPTDFITSMNWNLDLVNKHEDTKIVLHWKWEDNCPTRWQLSRRYGWAASSAALWSK